MKSAKFILLILCTISLFTKCSKENDEFDDVSHASFIIGVKAGNLTVVTFKPAIKIIAPAHSDANYHLDIDKDRISDFAFCSDHGISPGGVDLKHSYIQVLNPRIEISVREQSDTIHTCSEEYYEPALDAVNLKVETYTRQSAFSCPETGTDSVQNIYKEYYPLVYNDGDSVDFLASWSNENLTLSYFDNSFHIYSGTGKIEFILQSYSIIRGLWNETSMKYMLFRKRELNTFSYGWIKMDIHDYKEIWLHEYAILE